MARSGAVRVLDGKPYFPPESIRKEYFALSMRKTLCPWKGTAGWYHLEVEGLRKPDAAWCYPAPKPAAREIARYIAFGPGVILEQESPLAREGSSRGQGMRPPINSTMNAGPRRRPGKALRGTAGAVAEKPGGFAAKLKQWMR